MGSFFYGIMITNALVSSSMTEEQRIKVLSPYIKPAPGSVLNIDMSQQKRVDLKDPMTATGLIEINPPVGSCFTITRNDSFPDEKVCRPDKKTKSKKIPFALKHLNEQGELTWTIKTGKGDFGAPYTWKTPYRFAHTLPIGEKLVVRVPFSTCTLLNEKESRRLVLDMLSGERWLFDFPHDEKMAGDKVKMPNLYFPKEAKHAGVPTGKEEGASNPKERTTDYDPMEDYHNPKASDPTTAHWSIPPVNSYLLKGDNFKIKSMPPGTKGACRYRYGGFKGEPELAWIECHEVDRFDVLLTPLPCLKPRTVR